MEKRDVITLNFTKSLIGFGRTSWFDRNDQLNCVQPLSRDHSVKSAATLQPEDFLQAAASFLFSVWSNKLFIRIEKRLEIYFPPQ